MTAVTGRTRLVLILVAVVIAGITLWRVFGGQEAAPAGPGGFGFGPGGERPPTPVRVAQAVQAPLDVTLRALGTVTPLQSVTVRPRVDGELLQIAFEEGQWVDAGQLLAQIDPAPFQIRLAQAEGQQKQNLAELENARGQLQRFRDLAGSAYVSAQDVANLEAQVRQLEGRRDVDQAAVDEAALQLRYTRITAPVAGRVGLRMLDAGNLVRSGDAEGIATIAQTRPISVLFSVPETALSQVAEAMHRGDTLQAEAWDRGERQRLALGRLGSIDNRIDADTGTLRLRALFDNTDDGLFPNQFVNLRLRLGNADALSIPDAAVQFGNDGTYVYVIGDDDTASVRAVVLGAASGDRVAVIDGLSAGERVVLEGIDRLRDGARVEVVQATPDTTEDAADDTATGMDAPDA